MIGYLFEFIWISRFYILDPSIHPVIYDSHISWSG